ncbi:hypothetical protein vseg_007844 [Gypsophila vaccaria]
MLKPTFAWKDFKEAIEAQYYPQELKWRMEEQFMKISMEGMPFQDYHDQFVRLYRFAKRLVPTENDLVQFYIRRMVGKLRTSMLRQPITNISKAYQTALSLNASILEEEAESTRAARRNFTPHVSKTNFIKRPQILRPNFRHVFTQKPSFHKSSGQSDQHNKLRDNLARGKAPMQIGGFKSGGNSYKPGVDFNRCPGCQKPRHPNTKNDGSPLECW